MSNKQKAKTAGKIIIIVLSLAILFFLLLPFLDSPAASVGANGKKAVPQIFTSNPLSDLVQKVFALFKRDSQKATPSYHGELTEEMLASLSPEEQQKYALQRAEEGEKNFEYSTEVDANYDYGEAGIINENGEWILVRQTAPESSNLGMHEVNTRQSAYDRHIRQERAARYTGKAGADAGPAIPDSKWARLWKPIKAFFTGEDESAAVQEATGEKAYLLASSGTGLGKDRYKQGSTYRRGKSANISASEWELTGNTNGNPFYDILSSDSTLQNIADSYLKTAKETLNAEQFNAYEKKVNDYINQRKEQAKAEERTIHWELLNQKAQQEKGIDNIVSRTLIQTCGGASIASNYYQIFVPSCNGSHRSLNNTNFPPISQEKMEQMRRENYQKAEQSFQEKQAHFKEIFGIDTPQEEDSFANQPSRMVTLLGKTEKNPFSFQTSFSDENGDLIPDEKLNDEQKKLKKENELAQELLDFVLEEQGCTEGNSCYWVAGDYLGENPQLHYVVRSAGIESSGDPLNIASDLTQQFLEDKMINAPEDVSAEELLSLQYSIRDIMGKYLKYVPYNAENMAELNQENDKDGKNKFLYFIPQVSDALEMREVLPQPEYVIYDDSSEKGTHILGIGKGQGRKNPQERGSLLHQRIIERIKEIDQIKHTTEESKHAHEFCANELLRQVNQNLQEEMQQNAGESFDIQVGLQ